jgi:hypothetical protein
MNPHLHQFLSYTRSSRIVDPLPTFCHTGLLSCCGIRDSFLTPAQHWTRASILEAEQSKYPF